jgi:hypothetical protein
VERRGVSGRRLEHVDTVDTSQASQQTLADPLQERTNTNPTRTNRQASEIDHRTRLDRRSSSRDDAAATTLLRSTLYPFVSRLPSVARVSATSGVAGAERQWQLAALSRKREDAGRSERAGLVQGRDVRTGVTQ